MAVTLWVATYDTEQGLLVAVADPGVAGETYVDGDVTLDVDEAFYCEDRREPDEVAPLLREAGVANLAGEEAVELGVDCGVVAEENVLDVGGVPHAQMVRI